MVSAPDRHHDQQTRVPSAPGSQPKSKQVSSTSGARPKQTASATQVKHRSFDRSEYTHACDLKPWIASMSQQVAREMPPSSEDEADDDDHEKDIAGKRPPPAEFIDDELLNGGQRLSLFLIASCRPRQLAKELLLMKVLSFKAFWYQLHLVLLIAVPAKLNCSGSDQ